ncbi:MAG: hypothetical protein ACOCWH_03295 [Spirochaetota bacterium]
MKHVGAVLLLLLFLGSGTISADITFSSNEDFIGHLQRYFRKKNPEMIDAAIRYLATEYGTVTDHSYPGFAAFFAKVFSDNPKRLPVWREQLNTYEIRSNAATVFQMAMTYTLENMIRQQEFNPTLNDILWGGYYASGERTYVVQVIENMKHLDERNNLMHFVTSHSAKWSLSVNSRSHHEVKKIIQDEIRSKSPYKAALEEVLKKDPDTINEEMNAILKEQRENGVWE